MNQKSAHPFDTCRKIIRFAFLVYYVLVIPYRICYLSESLKLDKNFILFNVYDYVIVDLFFLLDTLEIIRNSWRKARKKLESVVPTTEGKRYINFLYLILDTCRSILIFLVY